MNYEVVAGADDGEEVERAPELLFVHGGPFVRFPPQDLDGDGPREPRRCGCELGRSGDWAARVVDPIAQRLLGPSVLWAASTRPSMRREASYVQKQSLYLFTESIRHDTPPSPCVPPGPSAPSSSLLSESVRV
jgi:hypothetical protein